jgi:glycosyltransferase involved in cell wall biosynthesis
VRIAWFSPLPPVRTGIAAGSAELLPALRARGYTIDAYPAEAAHDFVWRHSREPYDLIVYQFGNSSHHDYEWAYALRYPGLVVLHDTHLHHARAAFLLREGRIAEYRSEFRWNHPEVSPDAAELAIAGFDSAMYYEWPMVRALVETSRCVAVHGEATRRELLKRASIPNSTMPNSATGVVPIRLGHGELVTPERAREARTRIRATYGIADDAIVFGCFGGITPEKRIPQVLAALAAIVPYARGAHLLLAGMPAAHYDVRADIAARGLQDRVTVTGYLESDNDLTDHLAASDVSLNLRWPSARETSGPWLRALAAGVATAITDLVHLGDVPSLDPRTWTANHVARSADPVCVAIDILDEDHSLRLAMKRLATDAALRADLANAGREHWRREHTLDAMVEDYERIIALAASRPADAPIRGREDAPAHLRDHGGRRLRALLEPFGVGEPF